MITLPMVCPAATAIRPANDEESVLCGVLAMSNDGAHVGGFSSRGQVSPVMSGTRDPNVVRYFCAGQGVPGSQASYCRCEIWRAQRDAERAARRGPDALQAAGASRVRGGVDPRVAASLPALEG